MQTHSVKADRLPSIDILRSLAVALMILVNNPGSWSHKFDFLPHSPWNGCTPTDLVFPFFLFIVGASIWFAFRRYDHRLSGEALHKIFRCGLMIWAVGIVVSYLVDRRKEVGAVGRIFGVLVTNALFAYLLSTLFSKLFTQIRVWNAAHDALASPYARWYDMLAPLTTAEARSVLCALSLVALCRLATWPLYRKNIYIKL